MMKRLVIIAGLFVFFTHIGCARPVVNRVGLENMVQFNASPQEEIKKHFVFQKTNHYVFFRLASSEPPSLIEAIGPHLEPGDKVINLAISEKSTVVEAVVCFFIGWIYCPEELIIEGDVVGGKKKD